MVEVLVMALSLRKFYISGAIRIYSEQEETTNEVWPYDLRGEGSGISADKADPGGMLRKRHPQGLE